MFPPVDLELKEINVLVENRESEGFILNTNALAEIYRIARSAHLQNSFKILQHCFFILAPEDPNGAPNLRTTNAFPSDLNHPYVDHDLKEMTLICSNLDPEGFLLNEKAIAEILHIAEAGHMQSTFQFVQQTFFGVAQSHQGQVNILKTRNFLPSEFPWPFDLPSTSSIQSSLSEPFSNSAQGSWRSVDSNSSHMSLRDPRLNRYNIELI